MTEYPTDSKPTIYIVDPDAKHCSEISKLLEKRGYRAMSFPSAEDFLDSEPDPILRSCIVSEMQLPGMTGLEFLSVLRERHYSFPFVILTADPDIPRAVNALRNKVANYLVKPQVGRELANTIEAALVQPES